MEVILQYNPLCPHCENMLRRIRPLMKELDVPYYEQFVGGRSISAYEEDFVRHTYSEEWISRFGNPEQKSKLKKLSPVFELMRIRRVSTFPVLKIVFYDNGVRREIVIKGFPTRERENVREVEQFLSNLKRLILIAKRVEK